MFLMNVLPDMYICPLRKRSALLLPEVTVKCTHLANESGAIDKIRILVKSDTVKHLETFRIISSEMPVSFLTLS